MTPYYTQARFGKWDAILGEPKPPADQRFVTAIWHYARGLAYTRTRKPAEAQAEFAALEAIAGDEELGAMVYDTSGGTAGQRLGVAKHHLAGEMAAAPRRPQGGRGGARGRPIEIQDSMPYSEPPPFYFPVRQALGAVLLKTGRAARGGGRLPGGPAALPEERLVALRALEELRGAGQGRPGERHPQRLPARLGARRREAARRRASSGAATPDRLA